MSKVSVKKRRPSTYVMAALTTIAVVLMIVLIIYIWKYRNIAPTAFYFGIGALACLIVGLLVLFSFAFIYRIKPLKIITFVLTGLFIVVSTLGIVVIGRIDSTVNEIIDTPEDEQYEVIRVSYTTYNDKTISTIDDLNGKKVGSLQVVGSSVSAASVGRDHLTEEGINANYVSYNSTTDLFEALIGGDIDAAIFSNVFKTQLSNNDGFEEYLENVNIFETYEAKVRTTDEESSKKDITVEPFTVLLIGYAPEEGGGGLTDTIILASINPKTMKVLLTSIPRDSYVPISCYGGTRSKINDAGAASNACLMDTVEDLMGVNVDFYMKVNFQGVVDIVDAVGGIIINSPVEFVGQSSSDERGHYTVWIPAGDYLANGEEALAFARERHKMPNGDFDRQIHQQEVIQRIAEKLVGMNSVTEALKVLDAAGDNFSTNLSVDQLTKVFNYLISAPNYTNDDQFSMIDIQNSRLTGYTYWFYSYSMRLPLWSYQLFNGSIKENVGFSKDVLGEYSSFNQTRGFKFFEEMPYLRYQIFNEYFDEPREPENMPPYYPYLTSMTYSEAISWANQNGVKLEVTYITEGEPGYNANAIGTITDQYPRYGALVEEYPIGKIVVIGTPTPIEDQVPNFKGRPISEARTWANQHGIVLIATEIENSDQKLAGQIISQSVAAGKDYHEISEISVEYYAVPSIDVSQLNQGIGRMTKEDCENWASENLYTTPLFVYVANSRYEPNTMIDFSYDTSNPNAYSTFTFTIVVEKECEHKHRQEIGRTPQSGNTPGVITYKCDDCGYEWIESYCESGPVLGNICIIPKDDPIIPIGPSNPDDPEEPSDERKR